MARPQATPRTIAVARGEAPADLLITGGRVFSAATREWIDTPLAVADGFIAGWGEREAEQTVDVDGAALTPGFVDAHMHLESTKLWIDAFVGAVLPHGTTAIAADPHELANVLGADGIITLSQAAAAVPFTFAIYAPSCVPASPFESAGAELRCEQIADLIDAHGAHGVAEVMNYPGAIASDPEMLARIRAAGHRRVDGHAPGLSGFELDAYLAAGPESDHEATTLQEAVEKRRKGMWLFLRQGSASQDLVALAPTIVRSGCDMAAFCTDDREPDALLELGHINDCARLATQHGISEIDAILMASTNPARYHNLSHLGNLGPGYQADIVAFSELSSWRPSKVWQRGRLVASGGSLVEHAVAPVPVPARFRDTVHIGRLPGAEELTLAHPAGTRVRAVGVQSHSLTTLRREVTLGERGELGSGGDDVAYAAVIERHRASGRIGRAYAAGFGLRRGAIASTVAHDAHNIVVVGACGSDMAAAVARLAQTGGGQVAVLDGEVIGEVPLPLAGLMSDRPAAEVAAQLTQLGRVTSEQLRCTVAEPFMQLSFIALSVIPQLRLTDGGLVDVERFEYAEVTLS